MLLIPSGRSKSYITVYYVGVCYGLYLIQVVLTAVCLAVIYQKSQPESFSARTVRRLQNHKHYRLYVTVATCIQNDYYVTYVSEGGGEEEVGTNNVFCNRSLCNSSSVRHLHPFVDYTSLFQVSHKRNHQ